MISPHGAFSPSQFVIAMLVLALCLAFWGWMFRDMMHNDELPGGAKEQWTFVFILLNVFGAALYFGIVYRNRR